ncbi:MAG: enoyl-CoA hydratase-related protein [Dehalococcoidia bacterium]|nr:enoyl-CoA hydratase-related protein [Dehalococcoidia bacterium]
MKQFEEITLTREGRVAILRLKRPQKLNALTPRMLWYEITPALDQITEDSRVGALVITEEGKGFSAGADVSGLQRAAAAGGMASHPDFKSPEPWGRRYEFIARLRNLPKPTIAAVNGVAAGAGLSISLACDIRIASENARFSSAFIRRGLVPDAGGTFFLPRLLGTARALELMYTGDVIGAQEAERIGLVNRVVAAADLMTATLELASRIASGPPIALALTKRIVYQWLEQNLLTQVEYEAYNQRLCRETEDFKEGIESFVEKRAPKFKGR